MVPGKISFIAVVLFPQFRIPNMLCAVKLRVLGLMAYWYTGSAFHQIPQSYSMHGNNK